MSADLMTDKISSTSSICTADIIRLLYPSQTSMAVRARSPPQTQKYCPLLSSCFATSCMSRSSVYSCALCGEAFLAVVRNLRRHQIHQREDKHPHQINKVPIQPANFNVVRIVVLGLKKHDHGSDEESETKCVHRVVKYVAGWNHERAGNPDRRQCRQKPLAKSDHAQIDHADRHVQHVHRREPEEGLRKLRNIFRDIRQFSRSRCLGDSKDGLEP